MTYFFQKEMDKMATSDEALPNLDTHAQVDMVEREVEPQKLPEVLSQAILSGDLVTVQRLVEQHPELLRCELPYYSDCMPPLYIAVLEEKCSIVEFLLNCDVTLLEHTEDWRRGTVLKLAVEGRNYSLVELLLRYQADKITPDRTVLPCAVANNAPWEIIGNRRFPVRR